MKMGFFVIRYRHNVGLNRQSGAHPSSSIKVIKIHYEMTMLLSQSIHANVRRNSLHAAAAVDYTPEMA